MLSRIAGDEFICLLKNGRGGDEAMLLGEQAQARISTFSLEVRREQHASVGLNFGAAEFPANGRSTDELLHAASVATRQIRTTTEVSRVHSIPQGAVSKIQRGKSGPLALVR